jgi:hypothetical protein
MNQETKQLPVPSLNPEQVQVLISYANEKLPTMYGSHILNYIQSIAVELDRSNATAEMPEMPQS